MLSPLLLRCNLVRAIAAIGLALIVGGFGARAYWIQSKIGALSAPPSRLYREANLRLLLSQRLLPRVVLIGDSRISRWPDSMTLPGWEVINRGIGGESAESLAGRFPTDVILLRPDAVVIETGMNDLVAASLSPEKERQAVTFRTLETIRSLALQARAAGAYVIVATIIPPSRPGLFQRLIWQEKIRELVAIVNNGLREWDKPPRITLLDLHSALDSVADRVLADRFRCDTLHLNDSGYRVLANGVLHALTPLSYKISGKLIHPSTQY